MENNKISTRTYNKLVRKTVPVIKFKNNNVDGEIIINQLRAKKNYTYHTFYDGEVDIIFKGKIRASYGEIFYKPETFRPINLRRFLRREFRDEINGYTRLFGFNNVAIKKITFES